MKSASCLFRLAAALLLMTASLVVASSEKTAESPKPATEASIPFADHGGIRDWQVVDDETLRIQDVHGQWYLARLQSPAWNLHYSEATGFETMPSGTLEKWVP